MKVSFQPQSTSTDNKIGVDLSLRKLIKIKPTDHVVMLVGAPDGLERHYQNVLAWGGSTKNLTIIDVSAKIIHDIEAYHSRYLSSYESPTFISSDLNDFLKGWNRCNQIGVIDFDGTSGLAPYHFETLLHAERLEAKYLIVVACARIQDFHLKIFGEGLGLVKRKVYVPKEKQLETRGRFDTYYTEPKSAWRTTHDIFNIRSEGRGHQIVTAFPYYGVSPMVLSLIKIGEQSVTKYFEQVDSKCHALFNELVVKAFAKADDWEAAHDAWGKAQDWLRVVEISARIENQLEYIKTDEYKQLTASPHDEYMQFHPPLKLKTKIHNRRYS